MEYNVKALVARLNSFCHSALQTAAALTLSRTHYEVEIEHVLLKILDQENTDLHAIFRQYDIHDEKVCGRLMRVLDDLKTGNTRSPSLSPRVPTMLEKAWMIASLECDEPKIRSGHLLMALLNSPELIRGLLDVMPELKNIPRSELMTHFADLTKKTAESQESFQASASMGNSGGHAEMGSGDGASTAAAGSKTPALDQYTVNLTGRAEAGEIDVIVGRDAEIRQMVDILLRRRQNNPILTGEAGVGKTAVVEGLALRIAQKDVPKPLHGVMLRTLDLGLLQAGASVKGEFENRLKNVIDEVKRSPVPIILFIDEAHTMIGAGGAEGQNDAANLLKPALARGELRTIAATTWSEYKKYFEKDPALARRFQVVKIEEPIEPKAIAMMRAISPMMEKHHDVRILDEAIKDSVLLSHRYITGRQLPDKSVSVIDTACARVALSQSATPSPIETLDKRMVDIDNEITLLENEKKAGFGDHDERLNELTEEKTKITDELSKLHAQWEKEKSIVMQILALSGKLPMDTDNETQEETSVEASVDASVDAAAANGVEADGVNEVTDEVGSEATSAPAVETTISDEDTKHKIQALRAELKAVQGEEPLVHVDVDSQTIGEVISAWTGIPLGKMVTNEIQTVLNLKDEMGQRVIGQDHALHAIAERIKTSRANMDDPNRPIGVFLMVGPSGVGKTETALALADILYGGERNLITINMSEYQEAHTVSSLKGSPPGYVGYGEGGVLTEAVRRKPYSVVLLDEVEKAHPDVLELFFQVFDKGRLEDGEGREIDFKNTVIILTSNVGTDTIMRASLNAEDGRPDIDGLLDMLRPELNQVFKPAFVGRTITTPYYPVQDEVLKKIVRLKMDKIKRRIMENHKAAFVYGDDVVNLVADRCTEVDSGARNIDNILTGTMLPAISTAVLSRMAEGKELSTITVSVTDDQDFDYDIE